MELWQKIGYGLFISFLIVIGSTFMLGPMVAYVGGYGTADQSYHLPTHTLLIALIVTVVTCTIIILDKLEKLVK